MFIVQIFAAWGSTIVWMLGLAVGFEILAMLMPCNPGMRWWKDKRAAVTDLFYWFVVPVFMRIIRLLILFAGASYLLGIRDQELLNAFFEYGYGPISALPIWQQGIIILIVEDIMMYWLHRAFHMNAIWKFHAVHHSPTTLDWMTSARFHPINMLFYSTLADIIMLLCGFSPLALVWLGPFNIIYSGMVHANLNWTFGPFKYVFSSPVFHRWHHTSVKEGGMKNFAATFPLLDVVFGTFYMPKGKLPERYGISDPDFPSNFMGQMLYPFKHTPPSSSVPSDTHIS